MSEKVVTAIVIGAGNRGFAYSNYALRDTKDFKIVGIAEPRKFKREKLSKLHDIPADSVFTTWEEVAKKTKFADAVLITTMDQMHKEPAVAFAKLGYHILLEKPMATKLEDCKEIVKACRDNKIMLAVGHVLRYDSHAMKIKEIIMSGEIGQVINIQHLEPIGYWHFAHSFVRGNWRNTDSSTFLLMSKCCHDVDLIQMWLGQDRCKSVASFGSLVHFKKENKPEKAADRCLDCPIEKECPFSAVELYFNLVSKGHVGWPVNVIADVVDIENVIDSLRTGPYGRCVYSCDNNVNDNQVVILHYESGATVNLTTVAFTQELCNRHTTICGTKGEIVCKFSETDLHVFDFLSQKRKKYIMNKDEVGKHGHGESDFATIMSFVEAVKKNDESLILTGPEESLESHLICFAAEKARLENRVVNLSEYS